MAMKRRSPIDLYRASPAVTPSAQIDARVLAAARASRAPERRRHEWVLTGALAAAVVAIFYVRIETTPTPDIPTQSFGRDEGIARAWLIDLDLQQPTGPGSQEGLP